MIPTLHTRLGSAVQEWIQHKETSIKFHNAGKEIMVLYYYY